MKPSALLPHSAITAARPAVLRTSPSSISCISPRRGLPYCTPVLLAGRSWAWAKTIESRAVTIATADGPGSRVLIVVREHQHQWLVEMRRRFNLRLCAVNRTLPGAEDNPFERRSN